MSLPEIPDEAIRALQDHCPWIDLGSMEPDDDWKEALAPMVPPMYAAALRHAASRVGAMGDGFARVARHEIVSWLEDTADEAESQTSATS